jgi:hypothetical protein
MNRGANHLAEGETADSLANREKIRLSAEEWRIIKTSVEHGAPIPADASKNMLFGYHYALRQQLKQLAKERIEIQKRKDSAIAASIAYHKARSDASYTNSKRHCRHVSRFENLEHSEKQSLSKKSRLVLPIGRRARQHHTKDARSSARGSTNISIHNTAKPRRPKRTYAPSSTARPKDGRQQIDSKRRGGTSQQRNA